MFFRTEQIKFFVYETSITLEAHNGEITSVQADVFGNKEDKHTFRQGNPAENIAYIITEDIEFPGEENSRALVIEEMAKIIEQMQ